HEGVPRVFAEKLKALGAAGAVDGAGAAGFLAIDPGGFAGIALRRCESAGVQVFAGAALERLTVSGDGWLLVLDGPTELRARFAIDTTGDANAAALAGVRTEAAAPAELQHASYIFRIDGIDPALLDAMERA